MVPAARESACVRRERAHARAPSRAQAEKAGSTRAPVSPVSLLLFRNIKKVREKNFELCLEYAPFKVDPWKIPHYTIFSVPLTLFPTLTSTVFSTRTSEISLHNPNPVPTPHTHTTHHFTYPPPLKTHKPSLFSHPRRLLLLLGKAGFFLTPFTDKLSIILILAVIAKLNTGKM